METTYKVMKKEVADRLVLQSSGFELEPEIAAKLLRLGYKIYEVPVAYTQVAGRRKEDKLDRRNSGGFMHSKILIHAHRRA